MKIKIQDIEVNYNIFHRKVKYARLEIKNETLNIIMPHGVKDYNILIKKHEKWIYQKFSRINRLKIESETRKLDHSRSNDSFQEIVRDYVDKISHKMGLKVNRVTLRRMKTRWGSCSSLGNISINTRLKYLPKGLIKYVIHHEVCHLKVRKHDKQYWSLVSEEYPNYKKYEEELSIYWFLVKDLD
ncbi:MAG TPA: M48 family metallopeptidase [Methanothermobacter sp.]|nr:M48 family metallopeptidase [Methanothermobacter sp.]